MAIVNLLTQLPKPGGLWPIIIGGIHNGIGNLGWTIVIFTLIVKLVMTPFDFLMRWFSKKNSLVQQKLAPQVEKINKKYANDKQKATMQTQALYKREGAHVFTTCIFSLLYLVLTMVVFFTLFGSLRDYSAYNSINQYDKMRTTYYETLGVDPNLSYDEIKEKIERNEYVLSDEDYQKANAAAKEVWNQNKDGWLWIENIWRADSQENPMPTYKSLKSIVSSAKDKKATKAFKAINKTEYEEITLQVSKSYKGHWNGYYILAVLSIGLTFLSQWIAELGNKVKREKKPKEQINRFYKPEDEKDKKSAVSAGMGSSMKILKYVMPVIMALFVITSSAAFGIYIVVSSLVSTLTSLLINYLVRLATKKQEAEVALILEKQEKKSTKSKGEIK